MRLVLLILLTLPLLAACNKRAADEAATEKPDFVVDGEVRRVPVTEPKSIAILLAGTENDPWTAEVVAAIGAELGFDPWATPSSEGHLDTLGPYEGKLGQRPVTVSFALAGFPGLADLQSQTDLGAEALEWVDEQDADLVWLDGDQAQFVVGRELADELPIVFTGVTSDRQAFYAEGADVTGVYKRHSVLRVLQEITKRDADASRFALVADDGPLSRARVAKLKSMLDLVHPAENTLVAEPVNSWPELRAQLENLRGSNDAIIICGIGGDGGPAALQADCPVDLLTGIELPVIALGPTAADGCGPVVLTLRPAEHVASAIHHTSLILSGGSAAAIPTETPEAMAVYEHQPE